MAKNVGDTFWRTLYINIEIKSMYRIDGLTAEQYRAGVNVKADKIAVNRHIHREACDLQLIPLNACSWSL